MGFTVGICRVVALARQGAPTPAYYLYVKEAQRRIASATTRPEGLGAEPMRKGNGFQMTEKTGK